MCPSPDHDQGNDCLTEHTWPPLGDSGIRRAAMVDSAANDGTGNVNTVRSALDRLVAPRPPTA
ncbi:hypothetical protein [Streptomyces sp. NRRL B-24720]|uniref:hypothetical protein n=1 Tax=Streptomyces sp. NRRL B-24720 TaxID=1476876 RepID=UPI000AD80F37|nr:hypothetical protein [Streptomyces sp. NRRL B-24720]